jgi:hypothetical protein
MCHYAQLTFPVPAVIVAIVFEPEVEVEPVRPAPIVIVPDAVGNLKITTPDPPLNAAGPPLIHKPPAPPPVFALPLLPPVIELLPFPPPAVPLPIVPPSVEPPPPPPLATDEPVIDELMPAPPFPPF